MSDPDQVAERTPERDGASGAPAPAEAPAGHRPPGRVVALGVLLAAAAVGFILAWVEGWISPAAIQHAARESGPWAMVVYAAAVVLGELIWMPRSWGLVAGGLLFGLVVGGALSIVADLVSATITFFLARTSARDWLAERLARRPRAARIVHLLAVRKGLVTVAVLRMCPIGHYTLVSLAAGVTGVQPRPYFLGTAIGILPGAVLYPLLGDSLSRPTSPAFLATVAILVAALIVTLRLGRKVLQER